MKYYSTRKSIPFASFEEAIFKGLPEDNGLFMPEHIPVLSESFFQMLPSLSLAEIATEVLIPYVDGEIAPNDLKLIMEDVFSFDIPLVKISSNIYSLELFHGPTLAFKDVGARFLAKCLSYFSRKLDKKLTVLVATSGDTGSAVAQGFYQVPNIEVVILYPKGKVSDFQERQMTTLGDNITALEIDGNFDDCQKLVKQAFLDKELQQVLNFTSANSINIARLLPQSIYYFYGWAQLPEELRDSTVFAVPSGNYGNISAGLLAQKMGLPLRHFIAASNSNDAVPSYLATGKYQPKASISTISNAMDVGEPSNFVRMLDLFANNHSDMKSKISGYSISEVDTKKTISEIYQAYGYTLDPHGAVGFKALTLWMENQQGTGIVLETAHPIKFAHTVEEQTGVEIQMPAHIEVSTKEKHSHKMGSDFQGFKKLLVSKQ